MTSSITLERWSATSETSTEKLPAAIQCQAVLSRTGVPPWSAPQAQNESPKDAATAAQPTMPASRRAPAPAWPSPWPARAARSAAKCSDPQTMLPASGRNSSSQSRVLVLIPSPSKRAREDRAPNDPSSPSRMPQASFCSASQLRHSVERHGLLHPVERDDERQSDRGLGRRHQDHEDREDRARARIALAGERALRPAPARLQERQVGGVEHQLDRGQHDDHVLAHQEAQHAQREQDGSQRQQVVRGDAHRSAPLSTSSSRAPAGAPVALVMVARWRSRFASTITATI